MISTEVLLLNSNDNILAQPRGIASFELMHKIFICVLTSGGGCTKTTRFKVFIAQNYDIFFGSMCLSQNFFNSCFNSV